LGAGADDEGIVCADGGGELVFLQADLGVKGEAGLLEEIEPFIGQLVRHENAHG